MEVKYIVFGAFLAGSLAKMLYSWLSSGETFDIRRFVSTGIFSVFASILPGAILAISNIVVDTAGLFGLVLADLVLGWNTYSAQKGIGEAMAKSKTPEAPRP